MKTNRIIYWIATGLFSLLMVFSASMYLFTHDIAVENFTRLGFPTYLIYLMAGAKLLGVVALLTGLSTLLKEWAYAGFTFNMLLAVSAHLNAGDGEFAGAALGLVLVLVSYIFYKRISAAPAPTT